MAGAEWLARRFPTTIGRSAAADFRLEGDGVWEKHLELDLSPSDGFVASAYPNALAAVNGRFFQETVLRNGDILELGSVKLRFWLGETRQRGLRFREWLTWIAFGLIAAGQVWLIYWLVR
ncbi:MAG TPA: FHA domain-containing protein [Verrucomicrobiae bacterium]|nr:FHA domain-containing protein [Verrucomicrobiae bacterium]